jgi:uncharacterized protein (TIGR03067 family)
MRRTAILVVLCGISLAAKPHEEGPAMNDHEEIQGSWALVSGERHGKAFSAELVKAVTLEFSQDTLSTKNKDRVNKAKFKLHPATMQKGIDLDMDGSLGLGIYKLEGDTLTILHGEVDDKRPTEFNPKQTPSLTLLVLKRSKPNQPEAGQ